MGWVSDWVVTGHAEGEYTLVDVRLAPKPNALGQPRLQVDECPEQQLSWGCVARRDFKENFF
jgi:hypothetical protein